MNLFSTPMGELRSTGKWSRVCGNLALMLFLLFIVAPTDCRPPDETLADFEVGDEYGDVDNLELHHVKIINGTPFEDYKVIMYKEDFVSEDYDPNKNHTNTEDTSEEVPVVQLRPTRKYKDIAYRRRRLNHTRTEHFHVVKPEKIYFDVLPQSPVVLADDAEANDSKFDPSKIRVEVISLVDDNEGNQQGNLPDKDNANDNDNDNNNDDDEQSKQILNKRPKKYRHRMRRDTEHSLHKRNPYYRHESPTNEYVDFFRQFYTTMREQRQPIYNRYVVPGKLWNGLNLPVPESENEIPISFGDRFGDADETDRVVWGGSRPVHRAPNRLPSETKPPRSKRPPPPLFHDSNPENADWSFTSQPDTPTSTDNKQSTNNLALGYGVENVMQQSPQGQSQSICVRASATCCNYSNLSMLYNCFVRMGCERSVSHIFSLCN